MTPHEARLAKYGSTLTEHNVALVVERIADYPEIVAAALAFHDRERQQVGPVRVSGRTSPPP